MEHLGTSDDGNRVQRSGPGAEQSRDGGNELDQLVAEAERAYLCAEGIVVHGDSRILYGNRTLEAQVRSAAIVAKIELVPHFSFVVNYSCRR